MKRGKPWAGGLVALCLAAVVYLVITVPAGAEPPTLVTHTTLEDFNAGTLYHTGLTRHDDGEVQLLVVGLAGEWITETNTTGLEALDRHAAVQHGGHILVLGGRNSSQLPSKKIYYTTVQPDHDLANWATTTPLPSPTYTNGVYWHGSVVVHGRVYVLGGNDGSDNYDEVSFAPINANGTLGAWQATTPLPVPLRILQAVVVSDTIYVIGGRDDYNVPRDEIYYASVNPGTGHLSAWQTTTPFVHGVIGHMAGVHENRIYIMGGYPLPSPPSPPGTMSPWVHFATVSPGGDLSAWTRTIDMKNNVYGGAGLSYNGQLYTTGGAINQVNTPSEYVGASLIYPGGDLVSWVDTKTIEPKRMWHATVHSDDGWLYVINGYAEGVGPMLSINRGATTGHGDSFAVDGTFTSSIIDLSEPRELLQLRWNATITDTAVMTITMRYRTRLSPGDPWSGWYGPYKSASTPGTVTSTKSVHGMTRYFQYEAYLGTNDTAMTPALNAVELVSYKPTYEMTISKDSIPPPGSVVVPGTTISYTVTYTNDIWGITVTNPTVLDAPPEYTDYVPGSIGGAGADDSDPDLLLWKASTLEPGEVRTVTYAVRVTNTVAPLTILQNTATFTSTSGPDVGSNLVTHIVDVPELVLDVTKGAQPPPGSQVEPGTLITYTISYLNASLAYASQATLTDTHDVNHSYQVLFSDPPPNGGADNVWDLGALDPDDHGEITIAVQLTDTLPNNWIVSNQVNVRSPESAITFSDVVTHKVVFEGVDLTDLVVEDLHWEPKYLKAGDAVTFYATISNAGTLDATDPFWLSLYIRPSPSDPPFGPSDHDMGYCLSGCTVTRTQYLHYVGELLQGEQKEVWFTGPDVVFPAAGTYDVYVQIDVAFDDPEIWNWYWGAYREDNEYNNIAHGQAQIVDMFRIYLPIFRRNWP